MKPLIPWTRHTLRFLILFGMVAIGFLAHYRVVLSADQLDEIQRQTSASPSRSLFLGMDRWVRALAQPPGSEGDSRRQSEALAKRFGGIQGDPWSLKVLGVSLTDPLAGLESMVASKHATATLLLGLSIPVVLTLMLGRVFCSWICPAGLLFDLADQLKSVLSRRGPAPDRLAVWRGHKYVLLVCGLGIAAIAGQPLLGALYPPALMGREMGHGLQTYFDHLRHPMAGGRWISFSSISLFLLAIVLVETSLSRRLWCRYLCPGGALYSLLGAKRVLRLSNASSECTQCARCVRACPMGLNPMRNQFGLECDHCLECLRSCPAGTIHLRLLPNGNQHARTRAGLPKPTGNAEMTEDRRRT